MGSTWLMIYQYATNMKTASQQKPYFFPVSLVSIFFIYGNFNDGSW